MEKDELTKDAINFATWLQYNDWFPLQQGNWRKLVIEGTNRKSPRYEFKSLEELYQIFSET